MPMASMAKDSCSSKAHFGILFGAYYHHTDIS